MERDRYRELQFFQTVASPFGSGPHPSDIIKSKLPPKGPPQNAIQLRGFTSTYRSLRESNSVYNRLYFLPQKAFTQANGELSLRVGYHQEGQALQHCSSADLKASESTKKKTWLFAGLCALRFVWQGHLGKHQKKKKGYFRGNDNNKGWELGLVPLVPWSPYWTVTMVSLFLCVQSSKPRLMMLRVKSPMTE